MQAFNVYLNGNLIDTVYFAKGTSAGRVKLSLVAHDGYSSEIEVRA
jgi:hypothetical protein